MGLYPESGLNVPGSSSFKNKLFGQSESGSSTGGKSSSKSSEGKTITSSENMQQLSTSWEFIRPNYHAQNEGKDELRELAPPRFIEINGGKISLGPPQKPFEPDKEVLAARIAELEEALTRLQDRVNQGQPESPSIENDLKEQLDNMNRAMKSKDRRALQILKENKSLQARFQRQENCLQQLASENKSLHQRIRQYEHCLDDVMRKVVDAIVAEDNLREEVTMLKNRVRDLEAQNAVLSASPAKGRDEGYCTMSSGQPPPSGSHLEDLAEEPEQLLMLAEPCSADMEDWSMSQEELGTVLEEDNNESDWPWNSTNFLNSNVESQSETISQLLQDTIEYSDDEEIGCKDFTRDFYKLVSINSESTRSLQTHVGESDTDESGRTERLSSSPTPSEAGRAQVSSCSSSESGSDPVELRAAYARTDKSSLRQNSVLISNRRDGTQSMPPPPIWRKSTGWRRVSSQQIEPVSQKSSTTKDLPPPVPVRRSYIS